MLLVGWVALTSAMPELEKGSAEHGRSELLEDDGHPRSPVVWLGLDYGLVSQSHLKSRGPAEQPDAEARPTRHLGARRRLGKKDPFGNCAGGCTDFKNAWQWDQMMESLGRGCRCPASHSYCSAEDRYCYKSEALLHKNQGWCKGTCAPAWTEAGVYNSNGRMGSVQEVCPHGCACRHDDGKGSHCHKAAEHLQLDENGKKRDFL